MASDGYCRRISMVFSGVVVWTLPVLVTVAETLVSVVAFWLAWVRAKVKDVEVADRIERLQVEALCWCGRRATQRGTHLANGRPVWPNEQDDRNVPKGASLVGEHGFQGQGVPADFKFTLGPNQDIMPAIDLNAENAAASRPTLRL